jgi:hypothetical protein
MAIKQGSIFTPDKKKKLIDEIQRELLSVGDAIKEKGVKSNAGIKLNTIKLDLQKNLNILYDKKGVITPQETDDILDLINSSKRSRLESEYYLGLKKSSLYLVSFIAIAFGVYFYTKKRG